MNNRDIEESFPRNFLNSVACEIRFPTLLLMNELIPKFQEKIRSKLPDLHIFPFPLDKTSIIPAEMKEWIFLSQDENLQLKLGINRLAVIVRKYSNFESFYSETMNFIKNFSGVSDIKDYLRVGLRYVNQFTLQNEDAPLDRLLTLFNPLVSLDLIRSKTPFKFQVEFRSAEGKYKVASRNSFDISKSMIYHYIFDFDAYLEGESTFTELETIIPDLHILVLQEFHRNINEEFLELLRREV